MGALDEMSEHLGKPSGSRIQIEKSGETLRIVIPGRWTTLFWLVLLGTFGFTIIAGGMLLASPGGNATDANILRFFAGWGVLCFCWFFFVLKARDETVTFNRDRLETRGSFLPFAARSLQSKQIREFRLKPVGLEQLIQAPLIFYGFNRRKLLFASGPHEVALAVQAEDAEFAWLQSVLESHRRSLEGDAPA